ncbi:MAG: hypothetical protein A2139_14265 [Desulfobacca sp. RBG_16_60_12]|nr:MAG: hypothetical protein A2139_14265 [Desulfobacca sp. RBG_16_60_12]
MEQNVERTQAIRNIRAALIREGLSLRGFARKEGWSEATVKQAIRRYVGTGVIPRDGTKSAAILQRLEELSGNGKKKKPPRDVDPEGAL